jgi:hypothetical protein
MNPLLPNPYSPGLSPGQRVEEEEGERVSDDDGGGEGEEHHVVGYDGSDDEEGEERGKRVLKVRKNYSEVSGVCWHSVFQIANE